MTEEPSGELTASELAGGSRVIQWMLDEIAHRLPEKRVRADECTELAARLRGLAKHLDRHARTLPDLTVVRGAETPVPPAVADQADSRSRHPTAIDSGPWVYPNRS